MKQFIKDIIFKIYVPYIVRREKFKAVRMWRDGVRQCEKMYRQVGAPRIYLLFDSKHMVWAPMTYEPNKKLAPSFRVLRRMGKMRGMQQVKDFRDMKRISYYYTPSKWGALGCDEDNRVRTEKLSMWIDYYMLRLSKPMKKVRDYQRQRRRSC